MKKVYYCLACWFSMMVVECAILYVLDWKVFNHYLYSNPEGKEYDYFSNICSLILFINLWIANYIIYERTKKLEITDNDRNEFLIKNVIQKIKKYGSTNTGCAIMKYLKRIIYTGGSSRMVSFTYIIKDKFGIHARPGLLLVQEAGKLTSNITIFKGTDSGDAKRMFCVMNLAVKQGDQITVHVEGENEEADAEVMREF